MKKLLLGLGASTLAILPIAAMVSCSSSLPNTHITQKQFNVRQTSPTRAGVVEDVIDPALNISAQDIVDKLFDSLTKEGLQKDFDLILTDFYDIFEFENNHFEIELVDNGITVDSIGARDATTGLRTAKLTVKFEYEAEAENSVEGIQTKQIDWVIRQAVSSQSQIEQIKRMIKDATTNNTGIDITDLKEYFLGEKDDDQDLDDIGVFDRIAKLNSEKNLNNLGGLVGYELKLSDIFNKLIPTPKVVTMDTVFFAPSAALNNTFVFPSTPGSLNYGFNEVVLATLTQETLLTYTTKEQLGTILVAQKPGVLDLVKSITIESIGPLLKLTVNFVEANKAPEVMSINPSLLKQPTVPPVEPPVPATI